MTSFPRYVLILAFIALIVATPQPSVGAQETQFSLAVGESVTVGQYTLFFRGMTGSLPAYDLYLGSVLVARFPSTTSPLNPAEYVYGNGRVGIVTTGVAPDSSAVSGTIVAREN